MSDLVKRLRDADDRLYPCLVNTAVRCESCENCAETWIREAADALEAAEARISELQEQLDHVAELQPSKQALKAELSIAEIKRLLTEDKLAIAVEALEWYGDSSNYDTDAGGWLKSCDVEQEGGDMAREALVRIRKDEEPRMARVREGK